MDGSVLEENSSFKMLWLICSFKLDWGCYIISIAKIASKKIGAMICSMKFLSPEASLYFYKSTIQPCMEYYCHVWNGVPSCYLELMDKLQKLICRTVGPSLAASFDSLDHLRNVASLSLFYRYCLFYSIGMSPFLDVARMCMSTVFFLSQLASGILCLWNAFLWPMI